MEWDNLFEAYTREINMSQFFCHPYPAQWGEWNECTSYCRKTDSNGAFIEPAGVRDRNRDCLTSDGVIIEYGLDMKMCAPEPLMERQICNDFPCPEADVCEFDGEHGVLDCSHKDLKRLPFKIQGGKYQIPAEQPS